MAAAASSSSARPDKALLVAVAAELGVDPPFIEKDWHAVRAVAVLQSALNEGLRIAFTGGTSLSKARGLIHRFSEDLDFKIFLPDAEVALPERRRCRRTLVDALRATSGWTVADADIRVHNESRTFRCQISYPFEFGRSRVLRPRILVDVTFADPALPTDERSVTSFIGAARREAPEVPAIPCIATAEIAAEKLSALTWRVLNRRPGSPDRDGTLVRHLHDLAALEMQAETSRDFPKLLAAAVNADARRGDPETTLAGETSARRVEELVRVLATTPEYRREYARFTDAMCYGDADQTPDFDEALRAVQRLRDLAV